MACTQCVWAGISIIYSRQMFIVKELDKHIARRIRARYTPLQKDSFACCAVDRRVWYYYVHRYAYPVRRYVVSMRK